MILKHLKLNKFHNLIYWNFQIEVINVNIIIQKN